MSDTPNRMIYIGHPVEMKEEELEETLRLLEEAVRDPDSDMVNGAFRQLLVMKREQQEENQAQTQTTARTQEKESAQPQSTTVDMFHQYWSDNMVVIEKMITESPKGNGEVWHTGLEKMLVDLVADKLLLSCIGQTAPAQSQHMMQILLVLRLLLFSKYQAERLTSPAVTLTRTPDKLWLQAAEL